jgi:DNA-binding CsgD family transcriptional regulator/tetratricopeptide (TPR) repeat protein
MLNSTPPFTLKSLTTLLYNPSKLLVALCFLLINLVAVSSPEPFSPGNTYYKKLLAQYFLSLKQDERSNDMEAKAEDLNNIGNIFYTLRNYDKSLSYYRMSQDVYKKLDMPDAMFGQYFSLSKVYRDVNRYDSSWKCLSVSIQYFRKTSENAHNLMYAYYYSGELFHTQSQFKLAEKYYDSAIVLSKKAKDPVIFLECLEGKSKLYQKMKNYKKSNDYALEGLNVSEKSGEPDFTMNFRFLLYQNYKNLNKPELAFQNLEAYHSLNDSFQSNKALKAYTDMASSYEAVARVKENEILKQQNRNYVLAQKFYITALVLGLLLITSLLLLARQQRRSLRFKNQIIHHEKRIKSQLITTIDQEKISKSQLINDHQQALENVVLEKSQITDELERKNNDLLTATTYMIKTNEKLAEISANFRNIASKLQKSSSLNGEIYQTIEAIEKLSTKDTWDNFRSKFVDVHPNFFKNLNERCPGMTQNEMKLAAMISMNLSSKDIAKITMQQHNSINVARYRLRKKLNMESDDQLIGFLLQL